MKSKISVKLTNENINFLKRISINRIKADVETETITPSKALSLIEKYFKLNNNEYLELINMEEQNGY